MKTVSLVIPCYNEAPNIAELLNQLYGILPTSVNWELYFVDDGSIDNTYSVIQGIKEGLQSTRKDIEIHGIKFSRNYGKEIAVFAALERVKGDAAIIIDADLQHPPEFISNLLDKWFLGYKMVIAIRTDRNDENLILRGIKKGFYLLFSWLRGKNLRDGAGDFRLMDRQVIDAFISYREVIRFNKGIYDHLGFESIGVPFEVRKRFAGKSKWAKWALLKFALQGIVSFSTRPLDLIFLVGLFFSSISFMVLIYTLYTYFITGVDIKGYTTLATLIALFSGIQMIMLGIIGKYLAVLFNEAKKRPAYIVEESF